MIDPQAKRHQSPRSLSHRPGGREYPELSNRMGCTVVSMAVEPEQASWTDLEPMDAAQQPRLITKADVPRLGDRIKQVLSGDSQHRSAWEIAAYVVSLVLLMTASSIIWNSSSGVGMRLIESVVVLLIVGAVSTAALLKIRFRS